MKLTKAQIKAFEEEDIKIIAETEAYLASGKDRFIYPSPEAKALLSGMAKQRPRVARANIASFGSAEAFARHIIKEGRAFALANKNRKSNGKAGARSSTARVKAGSR